MARRPTKKPLDLYILRNARTRAPVGENGTMITHPSKQAAKNARDTLVACTGEAFVVSPGPQHKNWRG